MCRPYSHVIPSLFVPQCMGISQQFVLLDLQENANQKKHMYSCKFCSELFDEAPSLFYHYGTLVSNRILLFKDSLCHSERTVKMIIVCGPCTGEMVTIHTDMSQRYHGSGSPIHFWARGSWGGAIIVLVISICLSFTNSWICFSYLKRGVFFGGRYCLVMTSGDTFLQGKASGAGLANFSSSSFFPSSFSLSSPMLSSSTSLLSSSLGMKDSSSFFCQHSAVTL